MATLKERLTKMVVRDRNEDFVSRIAGERRGCGYVALLVAAERVHPDRFIPRDFYITLEQRSHLGIKPSEIIGVLEEGQDTLGLRIEKVELFPEVADELDETKVVMNLPEQVEVGRLKENETGEIFPDKAAIIYFREAGGEGAHWIAANPSRYLRDKRGLAIGGQADADYCVGRGYLAAFVCYLGRIED